mmetsp:Transcript_10827/g.23575  ORF Transcript_10827/g.23575 Transcript_10827/m.23575 type:complete len:206 (-) Transcript_10827:128-745(-)
MLPTRQTSSSVRNRRHLKSATPPSVASLCSAWSARPSARASLPMPTCVKDARRRLAQTWSSFGDCPPTSGWPGGPHALVSTASHSTPRAAASAPTLPSDAPFYTCERLPTPTRQLGCKRICRLAPNVVIEGFCDHFYRVAHGQPIMDVAARVLLRANQEPIQAVLGTVGFASLSVAVCGLEGCTNVKHRKGERTRLALLLWFWFG